MSLRNLGKFYKMNKIVPGGLVKFKKQSMAIKKAKRYMQSEVSQFKAMPRREKCMVSIHIPKTINVGVSAQSLSKV